MQEKCTNENSFSLNKFLNESKSRLQDILARLEWTEEDVLKNFNTNSKKAKDLNEHVIAEDDNDEEPPLPESCATANSIQINSDELKKILNDAAAEPPKKFSDLQVAFTREQKLQLYEHVIEHTEKCLVPLEEVPSLNDGELSFAEIVAQKKRNEKNKRKHRLSKPTHIEEVRSLVDLQMQALQQYLGSKVSEEEYNENKRTQYRSWKESGKYQSDKYHHNRYKDDRDREKYSRRLSRSHSRDRNRQSRPSKHEHHTSHSLSNNRNNDNARVDDKRVAYKRRSRSREDHYKIYYRQQSRNRHSDSYKDRSNDYHRNFGRDRSSGHHINIHEDRSSDHHIYGNNDNYRARITDQYRDLHQDQRRDDNRNLHRERSSDYQKNSHRNQRDYHRIHPKKEQSGTSHENYEILDIKIEKNVHSIYDRSTNNGNHQRLHKKIKSEKRDLSRSVERQKRVHSKSPETHSRHHSKKSKKRDRSKSRGKHKSKNR